MTKRSIVIVGPENNGVTTQTITDAMNKKFFEIKDSNPRGFMDQFEQQFDMLCTDIAAENDGQYDRREITVDGKRQEELLFCYGVSVEKAQEMISA